MLNMPLRFNPLFRRYIWGGRRLATVLQKPIGTENDYAESWEIVDHGQDQSIVLAGTYAGKTLHELVTDNGAELFGQHHPQTQFPLLFKFLDCNKDLSLQVHPNDAQAQLQQPPDLGKTEAWVFLDANPGSIAYAGLKRGFDRGAVEREINRGTLPLCLHKLEPQTGDCLFIPAGAVHALGAGFLVAEIQQASDTTFRLFDWNRVGADGKPRPLHIEQGLNVTDFALGPIELQQPVSLTETTEELVNCDKFVLQRKRIKKVETIPHDDRFHLLVVLRGSVLLEHDPLGVPLGMGETCLIPAACHTRTLTPLHEAEILDIFLQ
jgi:mannose-6-phosphate isomerase